MTGGTFPEMKYRTIQRNEEPRYQAAVYIPSGQQQNEMGIITYCFLPHDSGLQGAPNRVDHTQTGFLACGGSLRSQS